jgi:YfiH family protein
MGEANISPLPLIYPDWPAASQVRAVSTTRLGGVSQGFFSSLNLGDHVGDNPAHVYLNRQRLQRWLGLSHEVFWLRQVHGTQAVCAEKTQAPVEADAVYTFKPGYVCAVQTADCLPILFCDRGGSWVAAVHAGWRGLLEGVVTATLTAVDQAPSQVLAWLGPAIGPHRFEVGEEVRSAFIGRNRSTVNCFRPSPTGRWWADIYALARCQLHACGVNAIYGGTLCTYTNQERFFSYRRDGSRTGRMATLIWLEESGQPHDEA